MKKEYRLIKNRMIIIKQGEESSESGWMKVSGMALGGKALTSYRVGHKELTRGGSLVVKCQSQSL